MLKPFLETFSLKSLKPLETTMPGMLFLWWISTQCVFSCVHQKFKMLSLPNFNFNYLCTISFTKLHSFLLKLGSDSILNF
jgi:hypothetical protein